jgi:hypothetical protein
MALVPGDTRERDLSWLDVSIATDSTADARLMLFYESGVGGGPQYSAYLRRLGEPAVRLGEGTATSLSPDGRWLITIQYGTPSRLILLPTGPGEPRELTHESIESYHWPIWFPRSQRILFTANERGHDVRLYVQDPEGGAPRAITGEGVRTFWSSISPDERVVSAIGSDFTTALYPIDGGEPMPVPGIRRGESPIRWSGDGRALYVYRTSLPLVVDRITIADGQRQRWKELMPADPAGIMAITRVQLTADGRHYAYSYFRVPSDLFLLESGH